MFDELMRRLEYVPPKMMQNLLNGFIWEGTPESPAMAITFDDGPDPEITPPVLDALDAAGASATFFMVGQKVAHHPGLAAEVIKRGHQVGNHTMTHRTLLLASQDDTISEIDDASKAIADATGCAPTLFRPPHGLFDLTTVRLVRERQLSLVEWTVLSGDYKDRDAKVIMGTVAPFIRPGAIVVFHDTVEGGGMLLPGIIGDIAARANEIQGDIQLGCIDDLVLSRKMELDPADDDD